MLKRLLGRSAEQSTVVGPRTTVGLACALLALAGLVDFSSDADFIVAPFYLFPITLAAWWIGKNAGLLFCLFAAATLLITNVFQDGGLEARHLWNAGIWCSVFLAFSMLCSELRTLHGGFPVGRLLFKAFLVSALPAGLLAASLLVLEIKQAGAAGSFGGKIEPPGAKDSNAGNLLAELVRDAPPSLQASRAVLLGSRDLNGPSCVPAVLAGDLHDSLPGRMADLDGGPGTKLALLLTFDRQQIKGPLQDFAWHQSRLKSFLQTEQEANRLARERAAALSKKSIDLLHIIESWKTFPDHLPEVRFNQSETLAGYCLRSLTEAIHAHDLPQTKRWATELASATFATEDLHRWLALLIENHLTALDFQQKCASLFAAADPAMRDKYDLNSTIGGLPGGGWGINGIWNDYEVERQAESLFNIRRDSSSETPLTSATDESVWIAPRVRESFQQLKQVLSPANQQMWDCSSHTPYNRSYIVSMLYRMQRAGAIEQLAIALKRFDATHPHATISELMDVLMYRGNGFAGLEWPDRFQPQLMAISGKISGPESEVFRESHRLTNDFFRLPVEYGVTLTLREALEKNKLDCVRSTDMMAAIFRNAGGTGFANIRWSSEAATHSIGALLTNKDGKPLTLIADGMMETPEPEVWPSAFFRGHAWPERFKDNPAPYAVELNVRGLDNYLWAEGYIVRGPNAGTLQKARIPYLPWREKNSVDRVFAGPYPN